VHVLKCLLLWSVPPQVEIAGFAPASHAQPEGVPGKEQSGTLCQKVKVKGTDEGQLTSVAAYGGVAKEMRGISMLANGGMNSKTVSALNT
jgi:hypothetical protein